MFMDWKMVILHKLVYRFSAIPIKPWPWQVTVFGRNWQVDSKIYMEMQTIYSNENNFKKEQSWSTTWFQDLL